MEEAAGNRSQRRFNAFLSLKLYLTCNRIHLLIKDSGNNIIAESMQLIAGRTGQEYNQRKGKQGWKEKRDRLSFHRHVNSLYPRSAWCREFREASKPATVITRY